MEPYIETISEAIDAIKKSIEHWNDICYGREGCIESIKCELCNINDGDCEACPLDMSGNNCNNTVSVWRGYRDHFHWFEFERDNCFCNIFSANEAEAMLEALVQLLPPEHRKEYGG